MSTPAPAEFGRPRRWALTRRPGTARLWLPLVLVAGSVAVAAAPAQALPLTITVVINSVVEPELANIDSTSDADFYGRTFIEGQETRFDVIDNDSFIDPDWTATGTVDHTADFARVTIEIFDEDDFANFVDNQIDIDSGIDQFDNPRSLDLTLDLHVPNADCAISRDEFGSCNQRIRSFGNDGSDYAEIWFTITVTEPAQAPGLHVGCIHSPLWPQPGVPVTFTATSFGDQPDGQALPAKLADRIEIWYSTNGGVTRTVAASAARQDTFSTIQNAGANGTTLSYGCRLVDGGTPVYSGWRSVQIGNPPAGQAVPVLLGNADRERAIDFVLFPVTVNVRRAPLNPADTNLLTFPVYTGPTDVNFLTQAGVSVAELMREQLVLDNQRALNIWIARDGAATGGTRDLMLDSDGDGARDDTAPDTNGDGLPDGDGIVDACQHQPPANMGTAYGFANVRAFIHPATPPAGNVNALRECAAGGVFSAEATETGVFIHETGHAGWGLADEYCCDGGYRPPALNPNIYLSLAACTADVGSLGGVPADCRGFDSVDVDLLNDVWVSDPAATDLMNDNSWARRADRRRIAYVFGLAGLGQL